MATAISNVCQIRLDRVGTAGDLGEAAEAGGGEAGVQAVPVGEGVVHATDVRDQDDERGRLRLARIADR